MSLLPQFFFIALFVEMQPFPNLNVIKSVILHHVMKFELLIMCHCHLHNFLSHHKAAYSFVLLKDHSLLELHHLHLTLL